MTEAALELAPCSVERAFLPIYNDGDEDVSLEAHAMVQLTMRKVSDEVVAALKRRVAAHGLPGRRREDR